MGADYANVELDDKIDTADDIGDVLFAIECMDISENELSFILFTNIIARQYHYEIIDSPEKQISVLKKLISEGLDLNSNPGSTFTYGHSIMRESFLPVVEYALKEGFKFDSYTQNNWHSLELLQMNMFLSLKDDFSLLDVIKKELSKGIDLSSTNAEDFFSKLHRNRKRGTFDALMQLYYSDDYMSGYITKHMELIIDKKFDSLISKEASDIFIF